MRKKNQFTNFIKGLPCSKPKALLQGGLTVLISVLIVFTVVKASTTKITPPSGTPTATFYSLSEIYYFIASSTSATAGSPALDFSGALEDTGRTLTEIYNALAGLITANKVKLGTTYLGVDGALYGDTDPTKVLTASGGTYDATQLTAGNIKLNIPFGASTETGTLAPAGTASTTDCLASKTFYSGNSWTQKTGSIATQTLSADSETVSAGYYAATTLSGVDSDLAVDNIKKDIAIFGATGTLAPSGGTATTTDVCSIKTYYGANQTDWNLATGVLSIDASKMLDSATYCGTTGSISTQTLSNSTTTVNAGYYATTTTLDTVDTDLATGNIKSGITIFGVAGDSNVVDTSSGNATAANIATGTIAYVDGTALTGTFDPYAPQWLQTKDDWVDSGGTTGEYTAEEATWSAVTGSPFAGYDSINYGTSSLDLYSGTVKQDTRTGLWWSDIAAVDGGGTATTTTNSFTLSADGSRPTGGDAIGFCNALNTVSFGGYSNWYLPTQKELQQAYIDGSANNLDRPGYAFWSSSEGSWDSTGAWRVYLYHGCTYSSTKVTPYYVRCVRR